MWQFMWQASIINLALLLDLHLIFRFIGRTTFTILWQLTVWHYLEKAYDIDLVLCELTTRRRHPPRDITSCINCGALTNSTNVTNRTSFTLTGPPVTGPRNHHPTNQEDHYHQAWPTASSRSSPTQEVSSTRLVCCIAGRTLPCSGLSTWAGCWPGRTMGVERVTLRPKSRPIRTSPSLPWPFGARRKIGSRWMESTSSSWIGEWSF